MMNLVENQTAVSLTAPPGSRSTLTSGYHLYCQQVQQQQQQHHQNLNIDSMMHQEHILLMQRLDSSAKPACDNNDLHCSAHKLSALRLSGRTRYQHYHQGSESQSEAISAEHHQLVQMPNVPRLYVSHPQQKIHQHHDHHRHSQLLQEHYRKAKVNQEEQQQQQQQQHHQLEDLETRLRGNHRHHIQENAKRIDNSSESKDSQGQRSTGQLNSSQEVSESLAISWPAAVVSSPGVVDVTDISASLAWNRMRLLPPVLLPMLRERITAMMMLTLLWSSFGLSTAQSGGSMVITRPPTNRSIEIGSSVELKCEVRHLVGQVQWTHNGLGLGVDRALPGYNRYTMTGRDNPNGISTYNLQIHDTEVDDEGAYECQVLSSDAYPGGLRTPPAYLAIIVTPARPKIENQVDSTVSVTLHKPTNITCRADRGKPAAQITWLMNGERIMTGVTTYTMPNGKYIDTIGVLTYNATRRHVALRLECQATTIYLEKTFKTFATLDVQYVPNITMLTNVTGGPLREHDYVKFWCTGDANPQDVIWTWYRNDKVIQQANSDTYIIQAVTPDYDENTLSCEARNKVGGSRVDRVLEVKFGAIITEYTEVVGADLGKPARLSCGADGNPKPLYTWRPFNRAGVARGTLSTNQEYVIDSVTSDDFGVYVCTATVSGFPSASAEVTLLKNGKPNLGSDEEQMATEGKSARLECLAHSIPKPSSVTWTGPGGKEIDFVPSGRFSRELVDLRFGVKSILHITSVRSEDFGFYTCKVVNDYGQAEEKIQLVEKSVLPITFIIIGVIAGLVVIFVTGLGCVLFRRCRKEGHQGSVLDKAAEPPAPPGSYTDTDSSSDKTVKKRDKMDSPSTLMGQLRQDYNKEMYRFSADYDDMPYKRHQNGDAGGTNNKGENTSLLAWAKSHRAKQVTASISTRPLLDPRSNGEQPPKANNNGYGYIEPYETYSDHQIYDGEYVHRGDDLVPDRFDPLYGSSTGYSMSSFRANNLDTATPPPTMTRLTPLHMSNSKLATDV